MKRCVIALRAFVTKMQASGHDDESLKGRAHSFRRCSLLREEKCDRLSVSTCIRHARYRVQALERFVRAAKGLRSAQIRAVEAS
jgi:hypothetical protein